MENLNSHKNEKTCPLAEEARRKALSSRLKALVVVVACVLAVALGFASAAMSQLWPASDPGTGRSISLQEFQEILLH